jgi:hypothetical protein
MRPRVFPLLLGLLVVSAAACHRHRAYYPGPTQGGLAYGLGHDDPDDRKDAAEDLRKDGGPPPDAVPHLIMALSRETDPDAKEEELITLGASGAPEAIPVLQMHLQDPDKEGRKGAEKGLELWSEKTGQFGPASMPTIARLTSPEWKERREAADDLGEHENPPVEAVGPLIAAASRETAPKALAAELLTLGWTGAPEAKPVLEAHLGDHDDDVRRAARKAMKRWQTKNGQMVRRDVETASAEPPPGTPAAPTPAAPPPDGCTQFKEICGADPFEVDKCRSELKPLSYGQQVAWAECVNSSTEPCQTAHDHCIVKAKSAPK